MKKKLFAFVLLGLFTFAAPRVATARAAIEPGNYVLYCGDGTGHTLPQS